MSEYLISNPGKPLQFANSQTYYHTEISKKCYILIVPYPNLGLISSSVACSSVGKEINWGGIVRTDKFTAAVARFPFISDIVYTNESFP